MITPRLVLNTMILLVATLLALSDHCAIVATGVDVDSKAGFVLALQAGLVVLAALLANKVFPGLNDVLLDLPSRRLQVMIYGNALAVLASPWLFWLALDDTKHRGEVNYEVSFAEWLYAPVCCAIPPTSFDGAKRPEPGDAQHPTNPARKQDRDAPPPK